MSAGLSRCLVLLLLSEVGGAILIGEPGQPGSGDRFQSDSWPEINTSAEEPANTTFYYEANAFLQNKPKDGVPNNSSKQLEPAASVAMTSARNGRMLDLDALVGDLAASRANKERSQTGNRQSRFLTDVAGAKRLQIQGFIPIVGVKEATSEEEGQSDLGGEQERYLRLLQQAKQRLPVQPAGELPYAQSSIGHASLGVQRYLSSEAGQQQVEAKFSGASVVDSLKRPLKKLAGNSAADSHGLSWQQPQNCLCVPFYMCKNGYLSESSLSRSQIQQMIASQQAAPASGPRQMEPVELKSSQPTMHSHQFADSQTALIDERSLERELVSVTMGLASDNQTGDFQAMSASSESSEQPAAESLTNQNEISASNSSDQHNDYSQDILGRMLGLKTAGSARASAASGSAGGVCGLLRSCCNIPMHMFASQPASEQTAQRYSSQSVSDPQRPIYGMPGVQQVQVPRPLQVLQPLNSPEAWLAHRSSQFGVTRYPVPTQQVSALTRAAPVQSSFQLASLQPARHLPPPPAAAPVLPPPPPPVMGGRKILEGRCGLRQATGISGRVQNLHYQESAADFGEYPPQAAILRRLEGTGSDSLFVCGGALVSQYWVATAAHCIKKQPAGELKVRLGEWDVHRDDEFYPFVEKEVRDLVIHPEFVAGNLVNDIALLRLDSPVDPSLPHVGPACLPAADENFGGRRCWAAGWGKDSFGQRGSFQAVLREVELPVLGNTECESALRQTRLGPHYRLHSGFVCAGGEGGKDACEGDGGSGLYCLQEGLLKVVGLVSWGIGCGQAGVPGVYVNMAHYRAWIESIISIDEDIYSPYSNMIGHSLVSERSSVRNQSSTLTTTTTTTTTNSAQ